jgi:hypothetical protein
VITTWYQSRRHRSTLAGGESVACGGALGSQGSWRRRGQDPREGQLSGRRRCAGAEPAAGSVHKYGLEEVLGLGGDSRSWCSWCGIASGEDCQGSCCVLERRSDQKEGGIAVLTE